MAKRLLVVILILGVLLAGLAGCGEEEAKGGKVEYMLAKSSRLVESDLLLLQKKYNDLTENEQERIDEMMSFDMSKKELLDFRDDLKRLYIEKWQAKGSADTESLENEFEEKLDIRLWQKSNPGKPLIYRGLSDEEIAEIESEKKETVILEKDKSYEIEQAVKNIIKAKINENTYRGTKLNRITINENLGTDTPDDYIALIYLVFDVKNTVKTGNEVMRMYSDDIVATLAEKGITKNISEAAIFWEDDYNGRTVKYAYEYRDGKFYLTDAIG